MSFSSFTQSRFYRALKVYLISSSVVLHLLVVVILAQFVSGFLASGPTFAQALSNNGNNIKQNYPSLEPLGSMMLSVADKQGASDYYDVPFDVSDWPSVGPRELSYTEMVPKSLHDAFLYVSNVKELELALRNAKPRSVIVIKPGVYLLKSKRVGLSKVDTTAETPIYLVAEKTGAVTIELDTSEGFYVDKPHWHFMGINFKGVCASDSRCHHAFHVVGGGSFFHLAHSQLVDFSSAIKVNEYKGVYPDSGVIAYNHIYNTHPRNTRSPVNPINMDQGNDWIATHNIIRDFLKYGGNRISYGAYFKGGAVGGEISNNLVICETGESRARGSIVGLSLGGGGMNIKHRRENSEFETKDIIVRNNVVMHCTDVGLYVNKGQDSVIYNNTFYNTYGLDLRFPESSGNNVFNNVINGKIRKRDNGTGKLSNNVVFDRDYWSGKNRLQQIYSEPQNGKLEILNPEAVEALMDTTEIPLNQRESFTDFCGQPITPPLLAGAIQLGSRCFGSTK
ncbi:hypothetical protein [Vibrio sp. qd031]|uniref:hypothetical protein n=1 Tax=Vibrio sp. qd031 TaxID=1603038 RepID=UPI000A112F94|nr:hypothetical protein [Vibrio sp. qd031]